VIGEYKKIAVSPLAVHIFLLSRRRHSSLIRVAPQRAGVASSITREAGVRQLTDSSSLIRHSFHPCLFVIKKPQIRLPRRLVPAVAFARRRKLRVKANVKNFKKTLRNI